MSPIHIFPDSIHINSMKSFNSEKSLYLALSSHTIEDGEQPYKDDPLANLKKLETNLYGEDGYEDDVFKLPTDNLPKGIVVKRLKDILQVGSSIRDTRYKDGKPRNVSRNQYQACRPTYLSQIRMIPEKHFTYLIEPPVINEKGYYHVATVVEGRIIKYTVDDFVYYDQTTKQIYAHPFLQDKPWIHIILKVWARVNKGYDKIDQAKPFEFIRAFTYPDWSVLNPGQESVQNLIKLFNNSSKNDFIFLCKTKDDPKVGSYGLIPRCGSYMITGYYQQYQSIFIRIKTFVGDHWNGCHSDKKVDLPSQEFNLGPDEFIMPLKEFLNVYHLIYFTNNKFNIKKGIFYSKYIVNLDARESKAKLLKLEVTGQKGVEQSVNINFYLPMIKNYDLSNKRHDDDEQSNVTPYCKLLLGREMEVQNFGNQSSYADSVREKMLKNQEGHFVALSNHKFEYVGGDYVKGYTNEVTYHMRIKPGSYVIRLKVEKLLPEYRVLLNVTSSSETTISENKSQEAENEFLSEILSNKARVEEQNPIFPTPSKRQTWIMMNDDFQELGYGSILFQVGKNDNRGLTITLNHEKIRQSGYRLKGLNALKENHFRVYLKQKESKILLLKHDLQWHGEGKQERKWPPEGIDLRFDNLPQKLQSTLKM